MALGAHYCCVVLVLSVTAGVPGLEPRLAESESAGLPITPYPTGPRGSRGRQGYAQPDASAAEPCSLVDPAQRALATEQHHRLEQRWRHHPAGDRHPQRGRRYACVFRPSRSPMPQTAGSRASTVHSARALQTLGDGPQYGPGTLAQRPWPRRAPRSRRPPRHEQEVQQGRRLGEPVHPDLDQRNGGRQQHARSTSASPAAASTGAIRAARSSPVERADPVAVQRLKLLEVEARGVAADAVARRTPSSSTSAPKNSRSPPGDQPSSAR